MNSEIFSGSDFNGLKLLRNGERLWTEPMVSPRFEMKTAPAGNKSTSAQSGSISALQFT